MGTWIQKPKPKHEPNRTARDCRFLPFWMILVWNLTVVGKPNSLVSVDTVQFNEVLSEIERFCSLVQCGFKVKTDMEPNYLILVQLGFKRFWFGFKPFANKMNIASVSDSQNWNQNRKFLFLVRRNFEVVTEMEPNHVILIQFGIKRFWFSFKPFANKINIASASDGQNRNQTIRAFVSSYVWNVWRNMTKLDTEYKSRLGPLGLDSVGWLVETATVIRAQRSLLTNNMRQNSCFSPLTLILNHYIS